MYLLNGGPAFDDDTIMSMDPFSRQHGVAPVFEELAGQLRIEADHAIAGVWEQRWEGRNRIPHNRLFCVYGPAQAGSIAWGDGQSMTLRAGHCYHMPPGLPLHFVFNAGLRMLAFHYDCRLQSQIDLCVAMQDVSEAHCDVATIHALATKMRKLNQRSDLAFLQGAFMQLAAQFIPGDIASLSGQHRMQQRYEVVNEEIDISGAATRIAQIAEIMNMSVDQLSKRFRKDLGLPLKHYIDQVIAHRASGLLRHSDKKVKDIAEELHFRDEFTFSRFVKKHLHMSPRRYRRLAEIERV